MKIAILQCDDVLKKFQPEYGNYPQMVVKLLQSIDSTLEIEIFDVQVGEYPDNINEWDLFITTGSKLSAYDDVDWVKNFIGFVQLLDNSEKKLFGICFGHQAIAMAVGGLVENSSKGWGVGISSNRVHFQPEWMIKGAAELNLIVSHQDQVIKLSDGAKVIAGNDFCPHFMVQWSPHFLSIQGHPEYSKDYFLILINQRRDIIPAQRFDEAMASLMTLPDTEMFGQWILDFAKPLPK